MTVALAMREAGAGANDLLERLAADGRLGLDLPALQALLDEPIAFTGRAREQTAAFVAEVDALAKAHPAAAAYDPSPIL